ncbi:hypothetical protein [Streptomyces sp. DSM 40907]|uniref:hypothetical protein n=1 Tax=Streptomyces kutzneri TaxID=3051179 RepID=UPI0028D8FC04|nr:hypothetical protein [Streptomyces sp. DSM 40907]
MDKPATQRSHPGTRTHVPPSPGFPGPVARPRRRRCAAARVWLAVTAPAAVVLGSIVFHGLVDWP